MIDRIVRGSTLRRQLVRDVAGMTVLRIAQLPLSFLASVLLARTLGVEDYGAYTYVISLVALLALPAHAGLSPLLIREVAVYEQSNRHSLLRGIYQCASGFTALLAMLVVIFLLVANHWLSEDAMPYASALTLVGVVAIPVVALTQVYSAILQGLRRILFAKLPGMIVTPAMLLTFVSLLALGDHLDLAWAFAVQVIALVGGLFFAVAFLQRAMKGIVATPEYDIRSWRVSLLPFSAIALVTYLNTDLFVPLVGLLGSTKDVAYLKIAMAMASLIQVPLNLVESVIQPHVARMYFDRDRGRLLRLVSASGMTALLTSLPLLVVALLLGRQAISYVYGEGYGGAYASFVPLALGYAVVNLVGPSMQLLYATEFERDALLISAISLVLVAAMAAIWIPAHGAVGASLAFALGKAFRAITFRLWAHHRLRIN